MKIIKYIIGFVLILLNVISIAIFVVLWKPEIIINSKVAQKVVDLVSNENLKISWKSLDLKVESKSLLEKEIFLKASDVCVLTPNIDTCVEELNFAVGFKIRKPVVVTTMGPLLIVSNKVVYTRTPPKDTKSKSFPFKEWFDISKVKLKSSDIAVSSVKIILSPESVHEGSLGFTTRGKNGLSDFFANISVMKSPFVKSLEISSQTNNSEEDITGLWQGILKIDFQLPDKNKKPGLAGNINASLFQRKINSLENTFVVKGVVKPNKTQSFTFNLAGQYENNKVSMNLVSTIKTGVKSVPKIEIDHCSLEMQQNTKIKGNPAAIDLNCKVLADLVLPLPADVPSLELPNSTGLQLIAHVNTPFPPSIDKEISGNVELILDPILTPLFKGNGTGKANFSGIISKYKDMKIDGVADVNVSVVSFEELVRRFQKTSWAVPAPVNALSGTVDAGIKGSFSLTEGTFPVYLRSKLTSRFQALITETTGELFLNIASFLNKANKNKANSIKLEVGLNNIMLALPRMKLEKPPALLPDRRFEKTVEDVAKKAGFDYDIHIFTPSSSPIKIISNLAKSPVPISVNTRLIKNQPFSGSVAIGNFPVQLFRRNARVERLVVSMTGKEAPLLDGEVSVTYTDYDIRIYLKGTTEKPIVNMVSNPPLSDEQVIAVLIFGRTIDELDASQQESVGNTQSALADGTVGLASLYLLASTPIESLGYDPTSGEVSAKLRITDGTSLNLGTNRSGQESIGVRKRINKNLVITTDYRSGANPGSSSEANESNEVNAFLEWTKRY